MTHLKAVLYCSMLFINIPLFAADILVTASKLNNQHFDFYPSSIETLYIDEEESVANALKSQNSNIASSGTKGASKSLFLRGLDSSDTLVVLDGVVINDPSNSNRLFDFARLDSLAIEKIEILKGSQSVLYGTNAIAGVVYITTKELDHPSSSNETSLTSSYGSFRNFYAEVSNQGQTKHGLNYLLAGNFSSIDSPSAAFDENSPAFEEDHFKQQSAVLKLNYKFKNYSKLSVLTKLQDARTDIDNNGGASGDDLNDYQETREVLSLIKLDDLYLNDTLFVNIKGSRNIIKRETFKQRDHTEVSSYESHQGISDNFELSSNLNLGTDQFPNDIQVGLSLTNENDHSQTTRETDYKNFNRDIYFQHYIKNGIVFLNYGARNTDHQIFGSENSYMVSPGIYLQKFKYKTFLKYSTGFKAPTLFQLYDPSFGNIDLLPEQSRHLEWSHNLNKDFEVNLFHSKVKNKISFDSEFRSINSGSITSKGVEVSKKIQLDNFHVKNQFTFNSTTNDQTGLYLLRRPKTQNTFTLSYLLNSHSFLVSHHYFGRRDDLKAETSSRTALPSHQTIDITSKHIISSKKFLYLSIENLLNKSYEEVDGFSSLPLSFKIKFKVIL